MYGARTEAASVSDSTKLFVAIASWLIAMGAQFSGFTSPALTALLWLAGGGLFVWAAAHHAIERRRKGLPIVEPSHLILIGMVGGVISLALVAGGYAWQMLRSPAAVAGPTAAPNAGTKHLSSAEREERSKALIEARDIALKTRDFWDAHRQIQMNETLVPMIKDGKASIALEKNG
jgi:hypothetical protein